MRPTVRVLPILIVPVVKSSGVAVLVVTASIDITKAVPPVPPVSDDIVAPAGIPAPEIAMPAASVVLVPAVTEVELKVVVKVTVAVDPVAAAEIVIVVGLVIAVMYAPVGILVPEMACPTDKEETELTRTVVDPFEIGRAHV